MTECNRNKSGLWGSDFEQFFDTSLKDPAGYLMAAGIRRQKQAMDWIETRPLQSGSHYTLVILLKGGSCHYRNEAGFTHSLKYGDFLLRFPRFKHLLDLGVGDHRNDFFVSFAGNIFDLYRKREIITPAQPVWHLEDPEPWLEQFQNLARQPRPISAIEVAREATHFLHLLLDMMSHATPAETSPADNDWFVRACKMLTADMHHKADLQAIAREFKMSYHTFRFNFTQRAGMAPAKYRDQQRIKSACKFLKNPKRSCEDIAYTLGYPNGDYFSSRFKKHTGLSPMQYRKKIIQQKNGNHSEFKTPK